MGGGGEGRGRGDYIIVFVVHLILMILTCFQELKECFESRNVAKLQEVLSKLSREDAAYHMKRCVDSGLWVTDAKAAGYCLLCLS